ncbi:MAG TPA: LacI family transcriptional regulator [Clostridiaceae bacterium]|mgnify:FL=1|nr:LacI family transcriptional regulator [Clostridiaceae bacterium]
MKQVTIKEIAEKTGFSVNTVSRALSNRGEIKKETADLIRQKAKEMGYLPNLLARGLSGKRTNTIGLIMGETQNPYHWPVVGVIQKELTRRGQNLILANSEETAEGLYNAVSIMLSSRVDGLLMFYPDKGEESLHLLQKHNVPTVLLATHSNVPISYIEVDEEKEGYLATSYLLDRGCKKIAYISRDEDTLPSKARQKGWAKALKERGLDCSAVFTADSSLQGGNRISASTDFVSLGFDGIVAYNDLIAIGIMHNISERGYAIPEQISVIGFDNISYGEYSYPPLTTIDVQKEEIGRRAVEMLMGHIGYKTEYNKVPFEKVILESKLIVRKSTR